MSYYPGENETICALSTPEGQGGIAVIRVSGKRALAFSRKLIPALSGEIESHRAYFGKIVSAKTGEIIDEVVATYFKEGRSFTGEETIEISCHGSPYLTLAITSELLGVGCRSADRGEFTFRAFMNGRIDLVQAEGVLGLIKSHSKLAAGAAINQLRGGLSKTYKEIEDKILLVLSHLEASIDFTHEDIDPLSNISLEKELKEVEDFCEELIQSYSYGQQMREGCRIAIVGSPNVGKSSLLNLLVKEEKAIVSAQPGTTRDLIEGELSCSGVRIKLIDSAGIRATGDEIETIGVSRALENLRECNYALVVLDATQDISVQLSEHKERLKGKTRAIIINKVDLLSPEVKSGLKETLADENFLLVSAKSGEGIELIEDLLKTWARRVSDFSSVVISQSRHVDLISKIKGGISRARSLLVDCTSPEIIAFELQESVRAIHEILGKEYSDQVLERVFKEFCIGK